jgi:hypothetical protein
MYSLFWLKAAKSILLTTKSCLHTDVWLVCNAMLLLTYESQELVPSIYVIHGGTESFEVSHAPHHTVVQTVACFKSATKLF